ncbi:MAG: hypothetical protein PSN37_04810 [Alphaproteobacteria bacterium]|nr:hypothetical protein [Alphaproteobacteria bacterium]
MTMKKEQLKDGQWELMAHDPQTGRTVWCCCDGSATHFRTDYPVETLIEENTVSFNDSQGHRFRDGQRIASIPLNLFYEQLHEAQIQGDQHFISRWLNDAEHRKFRTFRGHV